MDWYRCMIYEVLRREARRWLFLRCWAKLVWDRDIFPQNIGETRRTGAFALVVAEPINVWRANTGKYSNKVRKLSPRRGYNRSRYFLVEFFTPRSNEISKRRISQRELKPSDVYRFSQWRFILASKVFCDGRGILPSCIRSTLRAGRCLSFFGILFRKVRLESITLLTRLFRSGWLTPSDIKTNRPFNLIKINNSFVPIDL